MSLRLGCFVLACLAACGAPQVDPHEPKTAKEKQLREARANGELDQPDGQWAGWRYQGDRSACFFVVGRRCFKSRNAACQAAHCRAPKKCKSVGGGPATMRCK
jgi:hypothetical protein